MLLLELCKCSSDLFPARQTTYRIDKPRILLSMVEARLANGEERTNAHTVAAGACVAHGRAEKREERGDRNYAGRLTVIDAPVLNIRQRVLH